jgi:hypothetical protein
MLEPVPTGDWSVEEEVSPPEWTFTSVGRPGSVVVAGYSMAEATVTSGIRIQKS